MGADLWHMEQKEHVLQLQLLAVLRTVLNILHNVISASHPHLGHAPWPRHSH